MTDTNNKPDTPWEFEEVPCDSCGSTDADVVLKGPDRLHGLPGEFNVVTCRQCSLSRTSPRPTLESLGTAYPEQYDPYSKAPKHTPPQGLLRWALVNFRDYPLGKKAPAIIRALGWPLARRILNKRRNLGYLQYRGEGKLLDFGCGAAGYVAKMSAAGWNAQGMDMSAQAVTAGREAGLTIHQGTLPGADLGGELFDMVTMWQAIEHVPSPQATLSAIHKI
ncbi:MAG: class I SAM-dependent methyltransferase, partial [bacterium]|nr:class I SAM-dependent methyltransferase [bacterium]